MIMGRFLSAIFPARVMKSTFNPVWRCGRGGGGKGLWGGRSRRVCCDGRRAGIQIEERSEDGGMPAEEAEEREETGEFCGR